ncbi:MAG TPA: LysR family transcriptional regulator [Oceanospirillaceae bacterium]|nr:LysR family transcriptional regulator [Oceanospirillaceae bacterium]
MAIKLSIRQLQMIRALEVAGSVSAAAVALQVSQSALSHRIREAERLLDTPLYSRQHKKLTATPAGLRVQFAARSVLAELERTEQDVAHMSGGVTARVRLGLEAYASHHWLPGLYQRLAQECPHISLEIAADVGLNPETALRQHTIDIALVSGSTPATDFNNCHLGDDPLLAMMSKEHPLAQHEHLTPAMFADYAYIAYHTNPEQGREYDLVFRRHHLLPSQVISAGVTEAVLALVGASQGITILPAWTALAHAQQYDLITRPIGAAGLSINWYLAGLHQVANREAIAAVMALIEKMSLIKH